MEASSANGLAVQAATPHSTHLAYRPHLDGLRTVAVYLVVAFHAGLGAFEGGFIGVDVFFVLSGFLVTSILRRDLASSSRVDRRRFYARRVRRILPAALVTLTVTAVAYAVVATRAEMLDVVGGFRAACLYVANWYFIRQSTNYFAGNIDANPVVHFWSLAVEEQFYLVWPLLLGGVFLATRRVGRYRWWAVRGVVFALAASSAVAAWHVGRTHLDRAYFGTDTRAYQLLVGALLALTPQVLVIGASRRWLRHALAAISLAGLVFAASSALDVSPITRGFVAAVLSAALIVALEGTATGAVHRALSSRPSTYLGRLSYGTYLWHWPVIVLVARDHHLRPLVLFVVACALSTALAALSFHLMERPIRASHVLDRFSWGVVAAGLTASVLVGLVIAPTVLGQKEPSPAIAASSRTAEQLLDWRAARNDFPKLPDCLGVAIERCTLVRGTKQRVLLLGDSHAHMWAPALREIAREESMTFAVATLDACPWQRGLEYTTVGPLAGGGKSTNDCARHQADWYDRVVVQFDPDIVFVAQPGLEDPHFALDLVFPGGRRMKFGDAGYERALAAVSDASVRALRAPGRKVVVLEPVPSTFPFNPVNCLSDGGNASRCAYKVAARTTGLERHYRAKDDDRTFFSLDLDQVVCPRLPVCDAVVDDVIVRFDANSHLTATFARSAAPQLDALLHERNIVPREP